MSSAEGSSTVLYPSIFTFPSPLPPTPTDGVTTGTSKDQGNTTKAIRTVLEKVSPAVVPGQSATASGTTVLRKNEHSSFLGSTFFSLPGGYVALDASKPWLMFWTLHSLDLMNVALDDELKSRAVNTVLSYQSPLGGFGGGAANSHMPHLLPTYAAVCSLAISGHKGAGGGWEKLRDARQEIYDMFMRCKRPDGGFVVCEGGEVDVRGTYCLLVVAALLDLLTPELVHNVDKFISACQTYEGGFACSSYSFGGVNPDGMTEPHRSSMAEAHGGYTSCSLLSHFLLASMIPTEADKGKQDSSSEQGAPSLGAGFPLAIDVRAALRWSVLMQGDEADAGGFRGRSNKLVDGCYSWWVGGAIPVIEELRRREREPRRVDDAGHEHEGEKDVHEEDDAGDEWTDEPTMPALFNKVALQEYILLLAQREPGPGSMLGGLRDKPGKRPDLYHTCNNLSGLSIAQHSPRHCPKTVGRRRDGFDKTRGLPAVRPTTPGGGWASEAERHRVRAEVYANLLGWTCDQSAQLVVGGKESRVTRTTPVVNIIDHRLKAFVEYFYQPEEAAQEEAAQ